MSAGIGQAGQRGSSVRSDAWVEITIKDQGGITLDLTSKVDVQYGKQNRELVEAGLKHFGIEHAHVVVEDQGAVPFVLMARIETAIRRALPDQNMTPWLPVLFTTPAPSLPKQNRRSRLYLPGNSPKFMLNAPLHNPDGVILDLEDSVAPSEKDAARVMVRNGLRALDFMNCERMVRINQGERGLEDLNWIVTHGVQLVLLPKVESPQQVQVVADAIADILKREEKDYQIWLMPIIESAKGAWFAYEIASAHETVVSLAIGLEDYTADIGAQRTNAGTESFWARAQVLNGARAAGVQPIDTVFSDVSDMDALRESVLEAKSLGFEGKGCIHPRQIQVVHEGFAPSADEIEKAKKITIAFEKAEAEGLGVVSLGSKMIDPPVVKRAVRIIRLAEEEGLLPTNWRDNP